MKFLARFPHDKILITCLLALVFIGCRDKEIKVYDAPKEQITAAQTLPEGWEQLPADQMSVASFSVTAKDGAKAKVTITPLPGTGGNNLDNVNRWRGQVGLQPISQDDLTKSSEQIQIGGSPALFVELSGIGKNSPDKTRILGAMQNRGDSVWFFKMMGNDQLVASQKPAFLKFLSSYQSANETSPEISASTPPQPAAIDNTTPEVQHKWNTPKGWQEQKSGPIQDAKFSVADGKATVTVSALAGTGGTLLANVNRWRGKIGLAPVEDSALAKLVTPLDLPGAKAKLIDMSGSNQRMIVAIVPRGDTTFFYKLLGDETAVGAEKNAFVEFVKSAK